VLRSLVTNKVNCIVSKSDTTKHIVPAVVTAYNSGTYYSPRIDEIVRTLDLNRRGRESTGVLSQREAEVVRLFASGMTVNEIAEHLSRSKKTISSQKSKAMEKLGIEREMDLLRYAMENGMVASSPRTSSGDVQQEEGMPPPASKD